MSLVVAYLFGFGIIISIPLALTFYRAWMRERARNNVIMELLMSLINSNSAEKSVELHELKKLINDEKPSK